jgi:DNA repair protein RadD
VQLRPYQREAVDAVYSHLEHRRDNPCVVIPTGGGKTPVIATMCRDAVNWWKIRVLVLAHVRELLSQSAEKIQTIAPELGCGIYSAGLNRKEMTQPVTVAGIQSIWKRATEFDPFGLIIVDEAHLIPDDGPGMYRHFIEQAKVVNPHLRVVGLTATPYRMRTGPICKPGPTSILNHVCYEIGVDALIEQGYLCGLRSKSGTIRPDLSGVHVVRGEYDEGEAERAMMATGMVEAACQELAALTVNRNAVLIFCCGIAHARAVCERLSLAHGITPGFVCGATPSAERAKLVEDFKNGKIKYMVNVGVFTTGFDAPNVDAVILLRPTKSPGLYYQMVGRGFRLHPDKVDCLVLDYGENIINHGPVDRIKSPGKTPDDQPGRPPHKVCPQCSEVVPAASAFCPFCMFEFPPREYSHDKEASEASILSPKRPVVDPSQWRDVTGVYYSRHEKRSDPTAPPTLRVDYQLGLTERVSEWVCIEHKGFAGSKARRWWAERTTAKMPPSVDEAVAYATLCGLKHPARLRLQQDGEWLRVTEVDLIEQANQAPADTAVRDLADQLRLDRLAKTATSTLAWKTYEPGTMSEDDILGASVTVVTTMTNAKPTTHTASNLFALSVAAMPSPDDGAKPDDAPYQYADDEIPF